MNVIPNEDSRRIAEALVGIAIQDDGKDMAERQWWHCAVCDRRWYDPLPEMHGPDCALLLAREVMENE